MSNLEEFINNLKLKTKDYNALETIRYVYLTLGFRMSFE